MGYKKTTLPEWVKRGTEVGKKDAAKYIYAACEQCGLERWVPLIMETGELRFPLCRSCVQKQVSAGERSRWWEGGRHKPDKDGYVSVWIPIDDPYIAMAHNGQRVLEHRLVMARHLGRCLNKGEIVHHKNGIRTDNRVENLEVMPSRKRHMQRHHSSYQAGYREGLRGGRAKQIQQLEQQVVDLQREVNLLKWRLQEEGVAQWASSA